MSVRSNKIKLLQEQQTGLRGRKSNVPTLQMQQQALKKRLLSRKPISEDRRAKIRRFQESQKVARDLHLQRKKEEEEKKKIVKKLGKMKPWFSQHPFYFPRKKRK